MLHLRPLARRDAGLLDLADARVLADPVPDPPLPPALLASLTRTVVARRRRRATVVAALAGAAAAALALAVPAALDLADRPPSGAVGSDARTTHPTESRAMVAQGDVPLTAELGLEPVTWGTRMVLTCTYDKDAIGIDLPEVDYLLFVTDERGRTEQVGSWTSVSGTTMTVPAATAVRRDDIADVEVRTTDGRWSYAWVREATGASTASRRVRHSQTTSQPKDSASSAAASTSAAHVAVAGGTPEAATASVIPT